MREARKKAREAAASAVEPDGAAASEPTASAAGEPPSDAPDAVRALKKRVAELSESAELGQALAARAPEILAKARAVEASINQAPTREKADARALEMQSFAGEMKEIVARIDEMLPRPLELHAQLETIITEAERVKEEARAEVERLEKEETRRVLAAADLARLEAFREQNRDRLLRHDYDGLATLLKRIEDDCQSDEGRAAVEVAGERYRKLAWLRGYMIGKLRAQPMRWGWGSGNTALDVLGADEQGIRILGRMVPWSGVSTAQFAKWAVMYSREPRLPERVSADLLLGLAVFYDEHHSEAMAAKARELALAASDSVRVEVDRLLPRE
jgi:hypothetical protein